MPSYIFEMRVSRLANDKSPASIRGLGGLVTSDRSHALDMLALLHRCGGEGTLLRRQVGQGVEMKYLRAKYLRGAAKVG